MDLIQTFRDQEGDQIISELTNRGFSAEQAGTFFPEALATLMQSLKGADITDLFDSAGSDGRASLLDSVDTAALASRTGVDSSDAKNGLITLIQRLMAFVKDNPNLSDQLGGKSSGLTSVFKSLHY